MSLRIEVGLFLCKEVDSIEAYVFGEGKTREGRNLFWRRRLLSILLQASILFDAFRRWFMRKRKGVNDMPCDCV